MAVLTRAGEVRPLELFDDTAAVLRPIHPSDGASLVRFHARLSRGTIYMRFFSMHLKLTVDEVDRFTNVDGFDRAAYVIESGGELISVARYDRTDDPNVAEVACVVTDAYQHRGLLLERLAEQARAARISTFYAETLAENTPMLGMLHAAG